MNKKWTVYMYQFPNGKKYIGATSRTLSSRQGKYWQKYKGDTLLWSAIQEFGTDCIEQTVLLKCDDAKEAADAERAFIIQYDTNNPEHGYNKGIGGEGLVKTLSEVRKEQLRTQMREFHEKAKGKKTPKETRLKQRNARLGRKFGPLSAETKAKIGFANSRQNMSEETRIRRSLSKQKKVLVTNILTQEELVFESGMKVAEYFHVKPPTVSGWIHNSKTVQDKYTFKFLSANND